MTADLSGYARDGYVLIKGAVPEAALAKLEQRILDLVAEWTGRRFATMHDGVFAEYFLAHRDLERRLYDEIRTFDWLRELSLNPAITNPVAALQGAPIGLLEKIVYRIDLPGVMRELAVWHQDFFYVKGNTEIVTAWVPMHDTPYENGCLMVMPGSQVLGALPHDNTVLGKRHFPSGIFGREVRYVPMQRGDLLLFNSLMLHSSGVNISERVRMSMQARFSRLDLPTDPGMGRLIPVKGAS